MKSKQEKTTLTLGLTGGFGCGKTTVASMFRQLGAICIDADKIYHCLLKDKRSLLRKKVIAAFGRQVLGEKGEIDRKKLARIVFAKRTALKELSRITHPEIIKIVKSRIAQAKKTIRPSLIVLDAPLLIEAGLIATVDKLVVVKTSRKNLVKRILPARGINKEQFRQRMSSQIPISVKIKLADYVIDNNRNLTKTRKQVKQIWQQLAWPINKGPGIKKS